MHEAVNNTVYLVSEPDGSRSIKAHVSGDTKPTASQSLLQLQQVQPHTQQEA